MATTAAMICSCALQPPSEDVLQTDAVNAAQQRGASELGCPEATGELLSKRTIEEPQAGGWYEPPHRAEYSVSVAGCGKQTAYFVECDTRQKTCATAQLQPTSAQAHQSAGLQPGAMQKPSARPPGNRPF